MVRILPRRRGRALWPDTEPRRRCSIQSRMPMKKFDRQTLTEQAYAQIKKSLIGGKFRPGQLMAIRILAESYGISATPIREALQRLVAEKLLVQQPNRTTIVPII